MSQRLITLPRMGRLALEFESGEEELIGQAITACFGGGALVAGWALADVIEIGGARLIFYREWDPCLIATDEAGDAVLRRLAEAMGLPA